MSGNGKDGAGLVRSVRAVAEVSPVAGDGALRTSVTTERKRPGHPFGADAEPRPFPRAVQLSPVIGVLGEDLRAAGRKDPLVRWRQSLDRTVDAAADDV